MEITLFYRMLAPALFAAAVIAAGSCSPVQQEGDHSYSGDLRSVTVDLNYYIVRGIVQQQELSGIMGGVQYIGYRAMGHDSRSGSPRGLVVLKLNDDVSSLSEKGIRVARKGDTIAVKVYGSPPQGLRVGDRPSLKCRLQPELVGAVKPGETFDPKLSTVMEFENCRLMGPVILTAE